MNSNFRTRKTYRIRVWHAATELGALSVDVVRGRWGLTRTDGSLAPLVAASELTLHFHIAKPVIAGSVTVGASGGTLQLPDGASLTVPPGALAAETVISAHRTDVPSASDFAAVYEFGPSGTAFSVPATLTVPVDGSQLPTGSTNPHVAIALQNGATWTIVSGSTYDQALGQVSAPVEHFSTLGVVWIFPSEMFCARDIDPDQTGGAGDFCDPPVPLEYKDTITLAVGQKKQSSILGEFLSDHSPAYYLVGIISSCLTPHAEGVDCIDNLSAFSGDTTVATIDANGMIQGRKIGRTVVRPTCRGNVVSPSRYVCGTAVESTFPTLVIVNASSRPVPILPPPGVIIQNDPTLGCAASNIGGYGYRLDVAWHPVDGATLYRIVARHAGAGAPLVDATTTATSLTHFGCGDFVIDDNLDNWSWAVAAFVNGAWSDFSDPVPFVFSPCRHPNGLPCGAPYDYDLIIPTPDPIVPPPSAIYNDPHFRTLDGLIYDFQAGGDYIVSRSTQPGDDFEIHGRFRDVGGVYSAIVGFAARAMGDVVSIIPNGNAVDLVINHVAMNSVTSLARKLPGGATLSVNGSATAVTWPDQSALYVRNGTAGLLPSPARRGKLEGLLGNFDGDASNDVQVRNGAVISVASPDFYTTYRSSWRVALGNSTALFTTGPDYFDAAPPSAKTLASFDPTAVASAKATCRNAGVVSSAVIDTCAYDIVATGDNSWANTSRTVDPAVPSLTLTPVLSYLSPGESRPFAAALTGTSSRVVTWNATAGSVQTTAPNAMQYTAPLVPGTYAVTATSAEAPSSAATASVVVGSCGTVQYDPRRGTLPEQQGWTFVPSKTGNPVPLVASDLLHANAPNGDEYWTRIEPSANFATGFVYEVSLRVQSASNNPNIGTGTREGYYLYLTDGSSLKYYTVGIASDGLNINSIERPNQPLTAFPFADGAFHTVRVSVTNSLATVFVDGIAVATNVAPGTYVGGDPGTLIFGPGGLPSETDLRYVCYGAP
jgi:hypothetical protein